MTRDSSAPTRRVDIAGVLDAAGLTRFHFVLLSLSCLITMFEGLDISLMSFTAPYIRDQMHLSSQQLGVLLTAAIVGQVLGSFSITRFADRWGRRPTIIVSAYLFSLLTIVTGFARNFPELVGIRFLDGLAIGGLLPTAWALNIEFAPRARRSTVVAVIMVGYSIGSAAAGPVTNLIAPAQGWAAVYFWAGVGTIVASAALHSTLPESVRFMVVAGGYGARVAALLNRIAGKAIASAQDDFHLADERTADAKFRVSRLFLGDLRLITPLLWAGYMASSFAIYLNSMWGPMLLEAMTVPRQAAALVASTVGLTGALLGLLLVRATEHWGPRGVMICPALALPVLLLLGSGIASGQNVVPFVMAAGVLINTGHAAVVSIAGIYYPSAIRASGGGWATAVAKCGAVFGPIAGGAILASHLPVTRTYAVLAVCPLVLCLAMFGIARVLRRRATAGAAAIADAA
jgi:MFS transporter, AAHS family, 4-hydroxybenzoate transporter